MQLIADLQTAFDESDRFTLVTPNDTAVRKLPAVYVIWGGMQVVGRSLNMRTVAHVVILMSPENTADPYKNAEQYVNDAIEIAKSVDDSYPELLPVLSTTVNKGSGKNSKAFAAAVIQVVSA